MKFYSKWSKNGKIGDTKLITRFLLFPFKVGNEWRWMKKATYEIKCSELHIYDYCDRRDYEWIPTQWKD